MPTALLYGTNALRNELLVLNPDTGQATVHRGPDRGPDPRHRDAEPALRSRVVAGRPHAVCAGLRGRPQHGSQDRLHTLDPDTGAMLTTVVVTLDRPSAGSIS